MKLVKSSTALFIGCLALTAVSCKKKYETPPLPVIPETETRTIDELRVLQNTTGGAISIQQELSVYGIITMDESDGNVYKNIYMQDHTGGINVRMLNSGGVYEGDSVRIYLKGTVLNKFSGVLQLDSVDVDENIVKQATAVNFPPEIITIDMITTARESQLIQLNNVQFVQPDISKTFADGENLMSEDRVLEDMEGNTIKVRTSGYASFADEGVPDGSGSIVCIISHFNGDIQLLIRAYDQINMNGERFPGQVLSKNFDDEDVSSGGWSTFQVAGPEVQWTTSAAGGAPNDYGVISNYIDGSNVVCENWLISPAFDLTAAGSPVLNFDNAYNFSGPPLEILISTDYDGISNPNEQGSWTAVPATLSTGGFTWVNSGDIPLGAFDGTTVRVAFKYTGTSSTGSTWELDNIVVRG